MAKRNKIREQSSLPNEVIYDKRISDFMNKEYLDYVMYSITNRAIPSIVDGMRTGARKILHAALTGPFKNGKPDKLTSLVGDTFRISAYPHGDASLYGTITELSAFYKDNLNPLEIDGQGGTLRNVDGVAAPRYLYILLSKYAKLLYMTDYDMIEFVYDEGKYLEPKFYLPIIPTILTCRKSAIGTGYASSCFSYNPLSIIDACLFYLVSGHKPEVKSIAPYVRGCKRSSFTWNEDKFRWQSYGNFEIVDDSTIHITDLPYDTQFSDFESYLNSLTEDEFIVDWENDSIEEKVLYKLFFKRGTVTKLSSNIEYLLKKLHLVTTVEKDNLTLLTPDNKVVYYERCNDVIPAFVDYRLTVYNERKTRLVAALEEKIRKEELVAKFISLIIKKKLVIANKEIDIVKHELSDLDLPHYLLDMKISKMTKTEYDTCLKRIQTWKEELAYIKATAPKQMYINDLVKLHNELKDDFE